MGMMQRINEFNDIFNKYTRQTLIGRGREEHGFYGDDLNYMSIDPDVVKLLDITKVPKKLSYLKFPYNLIYISNSLSFGDFKIPKGFVIYVNEDLLAEDSAKADQIIEAQIEAANNKKDYEGESIDGIIDYIISFYYETKDRKGFCTLTMADMWTPKGDDFYQTYLYPEGVIFMDDNTFDDWEQEEFENAGKIGDHKDYNFIPYNSIAKFLYKLLLFMDCPDVKIVHTQGRPKKFKNKEYHFLQPEKLFVVLSHDTRRYIQEIKHQYGVKFYYHYKYLVRGHFRTMRHTKYKAHKTIWIKPFFKGEGSYIHKEKIISHNFKFNERGSP